MSKMGNLVLWKQEVESFLQLILDHIEGHPCYDICDLSISDGSEFGQHIDAAEKIRELLAE